MRAKGRGDGHFTPLKSGLQPSPEPPIENQRELKICESCGGLFFRPAQTGVKYCGRRVQCQPAPIVDLSE